MAFDEVLNQPMKERELLEWVIHIWSDVTEDEAQVAYFLKLEHRAPHEFAIAVIRKYPSPVELMDDYFSVPYGQTGIFVKSDKRFRRVMIIGFTLHGEVEIHPEKKFDRYVKDHPLSDFNKVKLIPLELLRLGFADLEAAVSAVKDRKPA